MQNKILNDLNQRILLADGALGSLLIDKNLAKLNGTPFSLLNKTHAQEIQSVHRAYFEAGARLIQTNTFDANYYRLKQSGLEGSLTELNQLAVRNAREATQGKVFIAGIIGPSGLNLENFKKESALEFKKHVREQTYALIKAGIDVLILETLTLFEEMQLSATACLEESAGQTPVIISASPQANGNLYDGTPPKDWVSFIGSSGASLLGLNCLNGPLECEKLINKVSPFHALPIYLKSNAGLPTEINGKYHYSISADEFAQALLPVIKSKCVSIVGGCCGTTPDTIRKLAEVL